MFRQLQLVVQPKKPNGIKWKFSGNSISKKNETRIDIHFIIWTTHVKSGYIHSSFGRIIAFKTDRETEKQRERE